MFNKVKDPYERYKLWLDFIRDLSIIGGGITGNIIIITLVLSSK